MLAKLIIDVTPRIFITNANASHLKFRVLYTLDEV
jgi:hypothetical protein